MFTRYTKNEDFDMPNLKTKKDKLNFISNHTKI